MSHGSAGSPGMAATGASAGPGGTVARCPVCCGSGKGSPLRMRSIAACCSSVESRTCFSRLIRKAPAFPISIFPAFQCFSFQPFSISHSALPVRPLAQAVGHPVGAHRSPHLAFRPATRSATAGCAVRPAVGARHLAAGALPSLSRTSTVRSPARLLCNRTTHIVELVSIQITDGNTSRQQHKASELQPSPGQRRSPASPPASRRRLRPPAQHRPNRRLLLLRRLHRLQALALHTSRTKSRTRTPSAPAIFTMDVSEHSMLPRSTSPMKLWCMSALSASLS